MNVLFCGDENVCRGIFLSSLSLCKNTDRALQVYILTACIENHKAIDKDFCEKLQRIIREKNSKSAVYLFDISDLFRSELPLANMETRFTPLCMLRLFADMLPQIPDKILYLDTDVLCRSDFSSFYDMDMGPAEIAGVPDRYGKWFFGNILKHNYLNSGVLLLNMKNIRANGTFRKCRDMCRNRKMFMPDQTALNKLSVKIKVSKRYNEQGKIKNTTVFKHFTTYFKFLPFFHSVTVKPWDTEKLHVKLKVYEFDDILRRDINE